MDNSQSNNFYVYVYLDPRKPGIFKYGVYKFNYEPFYVGEGIGLRWRDHLTEAKYYHDTNVYKCNIIRKIWAEGYKEPIIIKFKENITIKEALDLETLLIETIGRRTDNKGPLTNIIISMDDISGNHNPNWGNTWNDEQKEHLRQINLGKVLSDEIKRKISESEMGDKNQFYGKHHTEEMCQHFSDIRKGTRLGSENTFWGKEHTEETKILLTQLGKLRTKYIYIITDLNNQKIIIYNLQEFCDKHNWDQHNIPFNKGKYKNIVKYKGFIIERKLKSE